ncbi:MAG TPA: BrnT family toxin [Bryobacteraceae bacterium]|nr:BrnT family toxin [Bryobacteraceae bacterium]
MVVWDERKRFANLEKHQLDFANAFLVFENPEKVTLPSPRGDEHRYMDLAMVREVGMILAFVYAVRGAAVRAISFRIASRRERRLYEQAREKPD